MVRPGGRRKVRILGGTGIVGQLTRGERLLQLVYFIRICDAEGVQVAAATDLELGNLFVLLDFDPLGVLSPGSEEELLDLFNLLGLRGLKKMGYIWRMRSRKGRRILYRNKF